MRHSKISKQKGRSIKLKETLKFSNKRFLFIYINTNTFYTVWFIIYNACAVYISNFCRLQYVFRKINFENIKLIKILSICFSKVQFLLNLKSIIKPYQAKLKSQQIIYFPVFMKRGHSSWKPKYIVHSRLFFCLWERSEEIAFYVEFMRSNWIQVLIFVM